MKKPVIGVTPAFDEGIKLPASRASLYLRRDYTLAIAASGAIPIILAPDMSAEEAFELCDGLVISGGEDIPAEVYGGNELHTATEPQERVAWERSLIDMFSVSDKPILGVCYGMQLLAVHYGGELYQDIAQEVGGAVRHVGVQHEIDLCADFLGLTRGHRATVASRHHQAVAILPEQFKPCAKASDGVIEAMSYGNIYGVQWHPESDDTGSLIYKAFAETCRNA